MAGGGAKKRLEDNARTLRSLAIFIGACAALYGGVRLGLRRSSADWTSWAALGGSLTAQGICYLSIAAVARPYYENGILIDGGADLTKGVISYYFDALYVTATAQAIAAFSHRGWYLLALVPAYAAYALVTRVLLPAMRGGGDEKKVQLDEETLRRMDKAERRAERRRVKRF